MSDIEPESDKQNVDASTDSIEEILADAAKIAADLRELLEHGEKVMSLLNMPDGSNPGQPLSQEGMSIFRTEAEAREHLEKLKATRR